MVLMQADSSLLGRSMANLKLKAFGHPGVILSCRNEEVRPALLKTHQLVTPMMILHFNHDGLHSGRLAVLMRPALDTAFVSDALVPPPTTAHIAPSISPESLS